MKSASKSLTNASEESPWGDEDASLLRDLRARSGLSRAELADRALISRAQLAQLEEGGESLFYSRRIKLLAGKRVLSLLGSPRPDRSTAAAALAAGPTDREPGEPTATPAIETPEATTPETRGSPMGAHKVWRGWLGSLGSLIGQQTTVHRITRGPIIPVSAPQALGLVTGLVALVVAIPFWLDAPTPGESAARTSGSDSRARINGPSLIDVGQPLIPSVLPDDPVGDTGERGRSDLDRASSQTIQGPSDPASPSTAADASQVLVSGRLEANRATQEALASGCPAGHEVPVTVESPPGQRPSTYVHLVATQDAVVCVRDAKGQITLLSLKAGQARSVHGLAPWNLSATDLGLLELYFQGRRIRPQDPDARHLRLQVVTAQSNSTN